MKSIVWLSIGVLLNSAFGLDSPLTKTVIFSDNSEEILQDYNYDKMKYIQKPIQDTAKRPIKNDHRFKHKIRFRIDATAVPCANATTMYFCEETSNQAYPTKYVESVLTSPNAQAFQSYFNKTASVDSFENFSTHETIELCNSMKRVIYPQLAMNVQNVWSFIINQPSYRQPIHVKICQKTKSKCRFNESFPNSYISSCVQKYTKVPLLSLNEYGELVSFDYEFPSFCQCELLPKKVEKFNNKRRF